MEMELSCASGCSGVGVIPDMRQSEATAGGDTNSSTASRAISGNSEDCNTLFTESHIQKASEQFCEESSNLYQSFHYNLNGRDWRQLYAASSYESSGITLGRHQIIRGILCLIIILSHLVFCCLTIPSGGVVSHFAYFTEWTHVSLVVCCTMILITSLKAYYSIIKPLPVHEECSTQETMQNVGNSKGITEKNGYLELLNDERYCKNGIIFCPNPSNKAERIEIPLTDNWSLWQKFKHKFKGPAVSTKNKCKNKDNLNWYMPCNNYAMLVQISTALASVFCMVTFFIYWFVLIPCGEQISNFWSVWNHSVPFFLFFAILMLGRIPILASAWIWIPIVCVLYFSLQIIIFTLSVPIKHTNHVTHGYVYTIINFNDAVVMSIICMALIGAVLGPLAFYASWYMSRRRNRLITAPVKNFPNNCTLVQV